MKTKAYLHFWMVPRHVFKEQQNEPADTSCAHRVQSAGADAPRLRCGAAARPSRLFLIADGPRADRAGEAERCNVVRRIVSAVNWPCKVETHFRQRTWAAADE